MFETFDHTADLGLRARAADLDTVFAEMAHALFAAIVEAPDAIRPAEELQLTVAGTDREYLLFDWLRELLFRFEAEHRVFARFEVKVGDDGLTASVWGEPYDAERHRPNHEVKAVTLHGLSVEQTPDGGWQAEVIVDI